MKKIIFLILNLAHAISFAGTFTKEMQCAEALKNEINETLNHGYFSVIPEILTFKVENKFYKVSDNNLSVCPIKRKKTDVGRYKIDLGKKGYIYCLIGSSDYYQCKTKDPLDYKDEDLKLEHENLKCTDIINKDVRKIFTDYLREIILTLPNVYNARSSLSKSGMLYENTKPGPINPSKDKLDKWHYMDSLKKCSNIDELQEAVNSSINFFGKTTPINYRNRPKDANK